MSVHGGNSGEQSIIAGGTRRVGTVSIAIALSYAHGASGNYRKTFTAKEDSAMKIPRSVSAGTSNKYSMMEVFRNRHKKAMPPLFMARSLLSPRSRGVEYLAMLTWVGIVLLTLLVVLDSRVRRFVIDGCGIILTLTVFLMVIYNFLKLRR